MTPKSSARSLQSCAVFNSPPHTCYTQPPSWSQRPSEPLPASLGGHIPTSASCSLAHPSSAHLSKVRARGLPHFEALPQLPRESNDPLQITSCLSSRRTNTFPAIADASTQSYMWLADESSLYNPLRKLLSQCLPASPLDWLRLESPNEWEVELKRPALKMAR